MRQLKTTPAAPAKPANLIPQQTFLREAMAALNMDEDQFAVRIGTTRRRLEGMLLPADDPAFVDMDEIAWKFIREILAAHKK